MSTFGAPSGALGPGMNDQSATESLRVRPATPPKARSGIGSTVRSGSNLPIASARAPLRSFMLAWSISTRDFAGKAPRACSAASTDSSAKMPMSTAVPGLSASPTFSCRPPVSLCEAKRPTTAPAAAPTATEASIGGANSPTRTPTPPPQPAPRRPRWFPVSSRVTAPSPSLETRIIPCEATCLAAIASARAANSVRAVSRSGEAATSRVSGRSVMRHSRGRQSRHDPGGPRPSIPPPPGPVRPGSGGVPPPRVRQISARRTPRAAGPRARRSSASGDWCAWRRRRTTTPRARAVRRGTRPRRCRPRGTTGAGPPRR